MLPRIFSSHACVSHRGSLFWSPSHKELWGRLCQSCSHSTQIHYLSRMDRHLIYSVGHQDHPTSCGMFTFVTFRTAPISFYLVCRPRLQVPRLRYTPSLVFSRGCYGFGYTNSCATCRTRRGVRPKILSTSRGDPCLLDV